MLSEQITQHRLQFSLRVRIHYLLIFSSFLLPQAREARQKAEAEHELLSEQITQHRLQFSLRVRIHYLLILFPPFLFVGS